MLQCNLLVSLVLVESVIRRRELLHRHQQITDRALEFGPLLARVKQLKHKALDLNFVKVGEHRQQLCQNLVLNKGLVRVHLVRLELLSVKQALVRIDDVLSVHSLDQRLENLALKLEATHMLVICHDRQSVPQNLTVETLVELSRIERFMSDQCAQSMHRLISDLHQLWFDVGHREEYCHYKSVELR